jgi:hypothetical protein
MDYKETMNRLIIFLLFLCLLCPLNAAEKEFIQLGSRGSGMFSIFNSVLRLLDAYEKGTIAGLEVDFRNRGSYFDKEYGPNWWQYYCQPIYIGIKDGAPLKQATSARPRQITRQMAHALITKYIQIKPHITKKVKNFAHTNFRDCFVIGIHYRGTDKIIEAPRVAYEEVVNHVQEAIKALSQEYKLFVATDEVAFLDFIQKAFPGKVCFQTDVIRSEDDKPIHLRAKSNRYKLGEDALTDCMLLAKTDYLIRTNSNLSLWSGYFNPTLPVFDLNQRYSKAEKANE